MRVATVQLTSTEDKDANLERADRHVEAGAAGAELVVLPENLCVLGTARGDPRGAETLTAPVTWARAPGRSNGIGLVGGSIADAPRRRAGREHVLSSRPRRGDWAIYRKVHLFDVEGGGAGLRSPSPRRRATSWSSPRGRRASHGSYGLLRPALPRALPSHGGARGPHDPRALRLHARRPSPCTGRCCCGPGRSRTRPSSSRQPGRRARAGVRTGGRSMIVDPWGLSSPRPPTPRPCHRRPRPLRPGQHPRRRLPSLANRRPGGLRMRSPWLRRPPRSAGNPRRRRPRLRPPGLSHLPRQQTSPTRRASPTGWCTTTSGPRTRCSTPSSSSAGTCMLAGDPPRSTRRTILGRARSCAAIAALHHRLLPPRPRPDEGHHRRGHAGREHVRPHPPRPRSARPTTRIAEIVAQAQADGRVPRRRHRRSSPRMAFYGAIEQVLTGWIFDIAAAGGERASSRPRR